MASTTPLLRLLDCILSQDAERTRCTVRSICMDLKEVGRSLELDTSPLMSAASLCTVIQELLSAFPQYAKIPSAHDGSLPIHFAASLGSVEAARIIIDAVSDIDTFVVFETASPV